jgi:serine protease Do
MNKVSKISVSALGLFLLSLFLSGCGTTENKKETTPQTHSNTPLENYSKVYLVPSHGDPRNVTPRVLARLKQTGFDVTEVTSNTPTIGDQGSGFIVTSGGYVLTCAHVIEKLTNATIWIGTNRYPCRVMASDTNADLALLLVESPHPEFRPMPFAVETNYAMGQDVFTMGFPLVRVLGSEPRLNKGLISATVGLDDDPKSIQVSAAVQPGNSGGPLLNPRGEAIGVVNATLNPGSIFAQTGGALPQNVNFAIKTGVIRDFLATNHVSLTEVTDTNAATGFEEAKKSLALVRPGNVTEEELKRPTLICVFGYTSVFGYWWRFHSFEIVFLDMKKSDVIFKTGLDHDNPFGSENGALNDAFAEISTKFFPDHPNPFKGKK